MDPFNRLIKSAEESIARKNPPPPVPTYADIPAHVDYDPDDDTCKFSILAVFQYSDGTKTTISFPRKPTGLTKRINNRFERPVKVTFKLHDADFKPEHHANLTNWKQSCRDAVTRSQTNLES